MGISVYPASGGGYRLQRVITTTGIYDLGNPRKFFVVLTGGGGGGGKGAASANTVGTGGGGGGAGAVAGNMFGKQFHVQIGAGGTGSTSASSPGGNGNPSYFSVSHNGTSNRSMSMAAAGGQGGSGNNSNTPVANTNFTNVQFNGLTGASSFANLQFNTTIAGCSGSAGGRSYQGSFAQFAYIPNRTSTFGVSLGSLASWHTNDGAVPYRDTTNTGNSSNYGSFVDPTFQASAGFLLDTTTTGAIAQVLSAFSLQNFQTQTSQGPAPGGTAGGWNSVTTNWDLPGEGTGAFYTAGGGGGTHISTGPRRGGSTVWNLNQNAIATGVGNTHGAGGGGGAGAYGDGSPGTGGSASGSFGSGGAGGLGGGGGGGGGVGGSGAYTVTSSGGTGGAGVCLIFY
jgi:hypothetical protein